MLTTAFLAKVFGYYLSILGLFILTRRAMLIATVDDIIKKPSCMFIMAVMTVFLGSFFVAGHNYWTMDWPVAITIIAWTILVSGVIRLFFPHKAVKMAQCFMRKPVLYSAIGMFDLLVGLYLLYQVHFINL